MRRHSSALRKVFLYLHRLLIVLLVAAAFLIPRPAAPHDALYSNLTLRDVSTPHQLATAFSPEEIGSAYGFSPLFDQSLDGAGQTVALIEIDGFSLSDIQAFDSANALPDPLIKEVYVGSTGRPFTLEKGGETAMDLEWLHALAPGAGIQVYYINNNTSESAIWRSMAQAVQQAADSGVRIVSISLGGCSAGAGSDYMRAALRTVARRSVSVFVSSGDAGDHPGTVHECGKKIGVAYPASDPSVVSVGGTSIQLTGGNLIARETAWRKSGGGKATQMARPSWQKASTLPKDKYRWAPDVAFVGDPSTGVSIYYGGRFHQAGGTSLGAPCWAAAWALVLQNAQLNGAVVGAAPKLLYKIGNSSRRKQVFHDITSGSNGTYKATAGWDPVTGWGSPDVTALSDAVEQISG